MPPSRRALLLGSGAAAAAALLPLPALAQASGRKVIFVVNFGGWDTTRVLSPAFGSAAVSMEPDAQPGQAGDLAFVDHPSRPGVRDFLLANAHRTALVHGVLVPSVAHMACLRLILTGRIAGRPDWPALLGADLGAGLALPQLVLSGPSYPETFGGVVTRAGAGGQLEALISGDILSWSDVPLGPRDAQLEALQRRAVDARAARSLEAATSDRQRALTAAAIDATARAEDLKAVVDEVAWASSASFEDQCLLAVEALSRGLSGCVSFAFPNDWDTHAVNAIYQHINWTGLFAGLGTLMDALDAAPGHDAPSLADETTVVVLSEMGRTPTLNAELGKDHWPYTSAMLLGAGVAGGVTVGGYDERFYGRRIDPDSGLPDDDGVDLTCEGLGATLLAVAGLDPTEHLPDATPVRGVVA